MYYYNINYEDSNKVLTGVVVLESFYEGEKDPRKEVDYYINIFKPRYNINDCRDDIDEAEINKIIYEAIHNKYNNK